MPAIFILRLLFGLASLAVLALGGYLLWSWYEGDVFRTDAGDLARVHEDWRLWSAIALLAFSAFGRFLVTPLLARPDPTPYKPSPRTGTMIASPTGASLYVEDHGPADGPTLLFTHGWGLDSTIWTLAKRDLGARYRLVSWDLPGLGRSKAGPKGIGLTAFAADLEAVMAWAGRTPPILIGHSIGGMTIETLARDRPDRINFNVAGVVLINTTYTDPLKTMAFSGLAQALRGPLLEPAMWLTKWLSPLAQLSAWQSYLSGGAHMATRFQFGPDVTRARLEHTTLLGVKNSQGAIARGDLAMFRWDATGAMKAVTRPILVLGGDLDIVTKPEAGRAIAASANRADLKTFARANHMGFLEKAEEYNAAIDRFATSLEANAPAPAAPRVTT